MARRNASDRAKATVDGNVQGPTGARAVRSSGVAMTAVSGKTLTQMQAQQMAERMFTDMMAAAGVSARSMMAELLYWVPDEFRDMYFAVTVQALRGTDGGTEERNRAGDETAAVGKAARKTHGGGGKKYKKYWVVADEDMLELKSRMDKRLRQMAREMREILEQNELFASAAREWAASENIKNEEERALKQKMLREESKLVRRGRRMFTCSCGIIISATWAYCPSCGKKQEAPSRRSTR